METQSNPLGSILRPPKINFERFEWSVCILYQIQQKKEPM